MAHTLHHHLYQLSVEASKDFIGLAHQAFSDWEQSSYAEIWAHIWTALPLNLIPDCPPLPPRPFVKVPGPPLPSKTYTWLMHHLQRRYPDLPSNCPGVTHQDVADAMWWHIYTFHRADKFQFTERILQYEAPVLWNLLLHSLPRAVSSELREEGPS